MSTDGTSDEDRDWLVADHEQQEVSVGERAYEHVATDPDRGHARRAPVGSVNPARTSALKVVHQPLHRRCL